MKISRPFIRKPFLVLFRLDVVLIRLDVMSMLVLIMMMNSRKLSDLVSVGKATIADFHVLGIREVADLKNRSAMDLYEELCRKTGIKHDICCLDVFNCAIAQAENPKLSKVKCNWWYWSQKRKAGG